MRFRPHQVLELWRCLRHSRRPLAVVRRYASRRGDDGYPFDLALRDGTVLTVESRHDVATFWVVWLRREYRLPAGVRTVLDIGANLGAFSLYAARRHPATRVVALEPFPATFARLRANVARNGLDGRVDCREVGVAATSGRRTMANDSPSPARSLQPPRAPAGIATTGVAVVTLAEALEDARERLGCRTIDYVKIDVEGAEHEAVPATPAESLRAVLHLGIEYHPRGDKSRLFAHLARAGLRLVHDRVHGRGVGVAHFRRAEPAA